MKPTAVLSGVATAMAVGLADAAWSFNGARALSVLRESLSKTGSLSESSPTMAQLYTDAREQMNPRLGSRPAALLQYSSSGEPGEEVKELAPIGEGAYQSAEAVKQRTMDKRMDCEEGDIHGCYHADGADFVDGHSYGNLKAKSRFPNLRSDVAVHGPSAVVAIVAVMMYMVAF
mmetsp:Transcript_4872/g.14210  ORF Transcript_4872/g.14210 Transcript_4872/m.14210 type:complete len:174 (-) Transcript_4872:65-586(-)